MNEATSITRQDFAEIVAFAVWRPPSASLNEILVRSTGHAL
jgi:NADP-dependent 3-hydroxy acid dehydrogenase YdfG